MSFFDALASWTHVNRFSGSGCESFTEWVETLEDSWSIQDPAPANSMKCARFKVLLDGSARSHFDDLPDATKTNFVSLKAAFQKRFDSKVAKMAANQRLASCVQKPEETVGMFAERFRSIVRAATIGNHEEVRKSRMLNLFVDKLHRRLRFHVRATDPTSFEAALEASLKYEALVDEQVSPQASVRATTGFIQAVSHAEPLEGSLRTLIHTMAELNAQVTRLAQFLDAAPR